MKGEPYERCVNSAKYIIENNSTVRKAAKHFNLSKSTVHKDVTIKLREVSPSLYEECSKVLKKNKEERHLRGGLATKLKYEELKKSRK